MIGYAGMVAQARRYSKNHVICIVDREDYKKWTVVGDNEFWQPVELGPEGWHCKCSWPEFPCVHMMACGLSWMVHHGVVKSADEIDDDAIAAAISELGGE